MNPGCLGIDDVGSSGKEPQTTSSLLHELHYIMIRADGQQVKMPGPPTTLAVSTYWGAYNGISLTALQIPYLPSLP